MKILVLEQNSRMLTLIVEYFENCGHEIVACRTIADAAEQISEHEFDGAIVSLSGESNAEPLLLEKFRRNRPGARIVVIIDGCKDLHDAVIRFPERETILAGAFRFRDLLLHLFGESESSPFPPAAPTPDGLRLTAYTQVDPQELESLKSYLMAKPEDSHTRWLLAFSYYRAGKYASAVHLLEAIVEEDPRNTLPHYYLGRCLFQMGRYADALDTLEYVLGIEPKGPLAPKIERLIDHVRYVLEED